jgi:ElaB/YqjD/DUF883 family membrane-anchored ribosome-binding protein
MSEVTKEKLIEDLRMVAHDVEELLRATAGETADKIAEARMRAEDSLRSARSHIADASDELARQGRVAAAAADDYVRDNPWQAIGVAAGIGLLVGFLLARR